MKLQRNILVLLFFSIQPWSHASTWTVLNFKEPLVVRTDKIQLDIGRGETLPEEERLEVKIAKGGSFSLIDSSGEGFVSVIGPALFTLYGSTLQLYWGDLYVKNIEEGFLIFNLGKLPLSEDFLLYQSLDSKLLRLSNLGQHAYSIKKKLIEPQFTYSQNFKHTSIEKTNLSSLALEIQRHESMKQAGEFGSQLADTLNVQKNFPSIPWEFFGGFEFGTNKLSPPSESTFIQDTGGFGAITNFSYNYYFGLVKNPQKQHYLKATALRFGLQSELLYTKIKPHIGVNTSSTYISFMPLLGITAENLLFDFLYGYQKLSMPQHKNTSSLGMAFQVASRFEFEESAQNEKYFLLGFRYSTIPVAPSVGTNVDGIYPQKFNWAWSSLFFAISKRF